MKRRRIIKPQEVKQDLRNLAATIATNNVSAARRFLDAAEKAFHRLAEMPEIGSAWESDNPKLQDLRVWPIKGFENYLIFYRPYIDRIVIVHVVHGARDVEGLFGP